MIKKGCFELFRILFRHDYSAFEVFAIVCVWLSGAPIVMQVFLVLLILLASTMLHELLLDLEGKDGNGNA